MQSARIRQSHGVHRRAPLARHPSAVLFALLDGGWGERGAAHCVIRTMTTLNRLSFCTGRKETGQRNNQLKTILVPPNSQPAMKTDKAASRNRSIPVHSFCRLSSSLLPSLSCRLLPLSCPLHYSTGCAVVALSLAGTGLLSCLRFVQPLLNILPVHHRPAPQHSTPTQHRHSQSVTASLSICLSDRL